MISISIRTIDHNSQRYETCGDWQIKSVDDAHFITISVSDLGDWRKEALVGIHEAIEAVIAHHNGVTTEMVDKFDFAYEDNRAEDDESEPGDDPDCPIYNEHQIATGVERILAVALDVDWRTYEETINALQRETPAGTPESSGALDDPRTR